jgi:coenzyme F420-reducing hydrogenase alpha subunit
MSSKTVEIDVHHVTRIEGHANIVVRASDGVVQRAQWQIPEAPRFFEAMLRGRHWSEVQPIVSRICGICSISHSLVSVKATEDAFGIEVSEQTDRLRILTHISEQLQSHTLHVGYLVAPDLLGAKSVVPLAASHPEVVKTVIRLHRIANNMSELLGGRTTHPVTIVPGGFTMIPTEEELKGLKSALEGAVPDFKTVAGVVLSVAGKIPAFERPTEYVALVKPGVYTFYHGDIGSTDSKAPVDVRRFESVANEYVTPQSTAKWAKWHRDAYAVGALARFNLSADFLSPMAVEAARSFGLKKGCCNPFMNSVAQIVECFHLVEEALKLIDELLTEGLKPEKPRVTPREGVGAAAVEAPRGILFHKYDYDKNGVCRGAVCCIPTNQNHGNIQKDIEALVPKILDKPQEEIRLALEMLVRAYDPCVSCSTHYLDVEFI